MRQSTSEDIRLLPLVACGYADDVLKSVFKKIIPAGIPGGSAEMLSGYGPLSDLYKKIRLAYTFDILSRDLMEDIDKIRSARNRIAHDWDLENQKNFYVDGKMSIITPIEKYFFEENSLSDKLLSDLGPSDVFRIRLIGILGRLTYEASAYHRAKEARLSPHRALYGARTRWLSDIAAVCVDEMRAIASRVGV
ncbi:MAG: hypothetical protein O9325_05270 [Roseomonas sp.]|nr:hypothetical protein [Roseomonas sp.]